MGFSLSGAAIAFVLLLPSLLYLFFPPKKHPPKPSAKQKPVFRILERVGQVASIAILILSKTAFDGAAFGFFFAFMLVALFFYLVLWLLRYFLGGRDFTALKKDFLLLPLPVAVLPVLVLLSAAAWIRSIPLAAAAAVFAVGHIFVTAYTD